MTDPATRPRLLFIYLKEMPFVAEDLQILRTAYDVRTFHFDAAQAKSFSGLVALVARQLAWLLRELPKADIIYGWFADYHLLLPVLLGKLYRVSVAIPLAGFDAIHLPELNYGVYDSPWRKRVVNVVLRVADLLLPVSETMIYTENQYSAYPEVLSNGIKAHVPGLQTPYEVIPFGYDPEDWPMGPMERPPSVCTVGFLPDDRTFRRKGIDLFFETARLLPEVAFEVVGVPAERHQPICEMYDPSPNVTLLTPVPREELTAIYGRTSVYAQFSRAEGQPNVLSEAMCCGCIPVGSDVFGIPETIGDTGVVVRTPEPEQLARAIRTALEKVSPEARRHTRQRVVQCFSLERRRSHLLNALSRVLAQP